MKKTFFLMVMILIVSIIMMSGCKGNPSEPVDPTPTPAVIAANFIADDFDDGNLVSEFGTTWDYDSDQVSSSVGTFEIDSLALHVAASIDAATATSGASGFFALGSAATYAGYITIELPVRDAGYDGTLNNDGLFLCSAVDSTSNMDYMLLVIDTEGNMMKDSISPNVGLSTANCEYFPYSGFSVVAGANTVEQIAADIKWIIILARYWSPTSNSKSIEMYVDDVQFYQIP